MTLPTAAAAHTTRHDIDYSGRIDIENNNSIHTYYKHIL